MASDYNHLDDVPMSIRRNLPQSSPAFSIVTDTNSPEGVNQTQDPIRNPLGTCVMAAFLDGCFPAAPAQNSQREGTSNALALVWPRKCPIVCHASLRGPKLVLVAG